MISKKKKMSYFQLSNGVSSFALTTQVIQETEWTTEVLLSRQSKLIQLLKKAWNLDVSESVSESGSEIMVSSVYDMLFYINSTRGANAKGVLTEQGFRVLKDSFFANVVSESFQSVYVEIRNEMIFKGILSLKGENLKLMENYNFSSPSTAASLVMGRSANGLTEWRN